MRRRLLTLTLAGLLAGAAWLTAQSTVTTNPQVTGLTALSAVPYTVTVTSPSLACAATTCDITLAVLPARTQILAAVADVTTPFACTGTCTSGTLSATVGTSAGGNQVLASFDVDAAAAVFGDADAEMGTGLTRAAAIQGGLFGSWSAATTVSLRLTSGTGNIGNGTATNLSAGTVTVYLQTRRY
jgi:hypothetical protein